MLRSSNVTSNAAGVRFDDEIDYPARVMEAGFNDEDRGLGLGDPCWERLV